MASKEFEKYLANLSQKDKEGLTNLGKQAITHVDTGTVKAAQSENVTSNDITQHSTPNDTYKDAHRTAAPETPAPATPTPAAQGNSATFTEIKDKPTTATTPTQTNSDKLTQ
jgi:cell division septation protein DedD